LPNFNTNDGGRSSDDGAAAAPEAGNDEERRDLRRSVTTLLDAMQVKNGATILSIMALSMTIRITDK
jgi:hypothetical protein